MALAEFGERRPELILGFSFFLGAAIRVDYAHDEVVLARSPAAVIPRNAIPLDVELLRNALFANGNIEGSSALYELDTGNAGAFDVFESWGRAHGIPGSRPTTTVRGKFGVGEQETRATLTRLARADFGPTVIERAREHEQSTGNRERRGRRPARKTRRSLTAPR